MILKMLIKILFFLLDLTMRLEYTKINKEAMVKWLYSSYKDPGLEAYFKIEDLRILKHLANGLENRDYWIYIGRRFQLLKIYDDCRREYELKTAKEQKV